MARPTRELEQEMLSLPSKERARLAHELLISLDEEQQDLTQEEWQTAWFEEVKRREKSVALDANRVMEELKGQYRKK